ncbi:MAG TPA: hypothetical protein VFF52_18955 [Isosphaeraceae bacterium]|nr:hypothetical protein [Isosphaeraceae bacterium]
MQGPHHDPQKTSTTTLPRYHPEQGVSDRRLIGGRLGQVHHPATGVDPIEGAPRGDFPLLKGAPGLGRRREE